MANLARLILAGLDFRYGWTSPAFPLPVMIAAATLAAAGYAVFVWATASNAFFSLQVRLQGDRGQSVASAGPYRFVRHPGYAGALAFEVFAPVALGSWWAMLPSLIGVIALLVRTALEDGALQTELPGYPEYSARRATGWCPGSGRSRRNLRARLTLPRAGIPSHGTSSTPPRTPARGCRAVRTRVPARIRALTEGPACPCSPISPSLLERAPGYAKAAAALRAGDDFTLAVAAVDPPADRRGRVPRASAARRSSSSPGPTPPSASRVSSPRTCRSSPCCRFPSRRRCRGRASRATCGSRGAGPARSTRSRTGRPAVVVASAPRAAAPPAAARRGGGVRAARRCAPAARSTSSRRSTCSPAWATSGSTRRASRATSPCAAGRSTSTRPTATSRCAPSCSATRSSRCAASCPPPGQSVGDVGLIEAYPCREIRLSNRTSKDCRARVPLRLQGPPAPPARRAGDRA